MSRLNGKPAMRNTLLYLPSIYRTTVSALLLWTATMGGFMAWDVKGAQEHAEQLARHEARVRFSKEVSVRNWVNSHGGVYVPATEATPPNPWLSQMPERDIVTPSGKRLTLVNPAYAMRLLATQFPDPYGARSRLTSLKPLNPINAPDAWEAAVLRRFEQGETEVAEVSEIDGKPYLRQMGALHVVKGCLKCHAVQGYKEGDVRGGIVVSVPMQSYLDAVERRIGKLVWPLAAIWLAGVALIVLLAMQVRRRVIEQQASEATLRKNSAEIVSAHADLKRFADVAAHHLMEPTRRLVSYTQLLERGLIAYPDAQADQDVQSYMQYMVRDAGRLRDLVRDIQLYLVAGQPRGEVRSEDANSVVEKVAKRLTDEMRHAHAELVCGSLPPARIDRQRFTDLFTILIDNALKHGRPVGENGALRIEIAGERDGAVSRYRISDNGPGIPAEYGERVFDIFETLQGVDEGSTGIGLSIARRIVESRHGRIWIEDAVQGGTTVVFELPDGE